MTRVLVLGGGPDAEREISIQSATAVHEACARAGLDPTLEIVDAPTQSEVDAWETDVVFPVLHGRFGEGGHLQSMLVQASHAFIGCSVHASRRAMDKLGTKLEAARLGIPTLASTVLDPSDGPTSVPPLGLPVVIKPIADGSSFGLHFCRDQSGWESAMRAVQSERRSDPGRISMIEPMVQGRELTVPLLIDERGELQALPIVEICPASGVYDYQAKYERSDTVYTVSPDLPDDLDERLRRWSSALCTSLGVRHLARVDFMLDADGHAVLLELNTMPGFTPSSLLPKSARSVGLEMSGLCARLVQAALRERAAFGE